MSFSDFPLWAKIVGPILIFLASGGVFAGYFFSRKIAFKTDKDGKPAWYNRVWPLAVLTFGIVLFLFGIAYIVASNNVSLFGASG